MLAHSMSVPQRITVLNNIFADFGIEIYPNSNLDQLIKSEFGRGKRSKVTALLNEMHQETEAAKLARCIGAELKHGTRDPQILAVANVLSERVPGLLEIVDVRQNIAKRTQLLNELLAHFSNKLPHGLETERLHRMLQAVQQNLQLNQSAQLVGNVIENAGVFCNVAQLKTFGKILQQVTPALIALDQENYPLEQKINLSMLALRTLSKELRDTKMERVADAVENVHWIAKVALPHVDAKVTVEQALQSLGISVGAVSTNMLLKQGAKLGLTADEMVQIVYASGKQEQLSESSQMLLAGTFNNQRYAAICGFLARLAHDAKQPELAKLSVAGICLASMRQTYYELKSNNLNPGNFSESLGTIVLVAGTVTNNPTLSHVGNSILAGVKTYVGVMGVPGGAAIAIPIAVCSILGKLLLDVPRGSGDETIQVQDALQSLMQQVLQLQQQMRYEFGNLYKVLEAQHKELLLALDQGFNNLTHLVSYNNAQLLNNMRVFDQKLQDLQLQINQEFVDLYMEYVRDPLEEVDYATRYGKISSDKLQNSKHKLAMWLLYKSKHPKVNGRNLDLDRLPSACNADPSACLALVNRYVNITFDQALPENLPHLPTWLQAAHAYTQLAATIAVEGDELQFLHDVSQEGKLITDFVTGLATNKKLWQRLQSAILQTTEQVNSRWNMMKLQIRQDYLQELSRLLHVPTQQTAWHAQAATEYQLEPFTPMAVDISAVWDAHIAKHIPTEISAAVAHGLGSWQITYMVDSRANTFANLHIEYGDNTLPNHSRDVLFRIDVGFKPKDADKTYNLTTTWLAYDLRDARFRVENYYKRKFKYGLRHNLYNWISIDGRSNQVQGHGNTSTHKIIDHDRLANIYTEWLGQAVPINDSAVLGRIVDNPLFASQYAALLNTGECTQVNTQTILQLQLQLFEQLRILMQQRRVEYAAILQQDAVLIKGLEKLDVYYAIVAIYLRLLNVPFAARKLLHNFHSLLGMLQQTDSIDQDLVKHLDLLFAVPTLALHPEDQYLQGEFYQKLQAVLARMVLLETGIHVQKLSEGMPSVSLPVCKPL